MAFVGWNIGDRLHLKYPRWSGLGLVLRGWKKGEGRGGLGGGIRVGGGGTETETDTPSSSHTSRVSVSKFYLKTLLCLLHF